MGYIRVITHLPSIYSPSWEIQYNIFRNDGSFWMRDKPLRNWQMVKRGETRKPTGLKITVLGLPGTEKKKTSAETLSEESNQKKCCFFPDGGSYLKDPDMSETNPGEKPYNPIVGSRDFSTF